MAWKGGKKQSRCAHKKLTNWQFGLDRGNNIFANIFSAVVLLVICAGFGKIIMITPALGFPLLMKIIIIGLCGYMLVRGSYTAICFIIRKNQAVRRGRRWKKI
ncbi:MAG: hypothetical protein ABIH68_01200 [bacterium]